MQLFYHPNIIDNDNDVFFGKDESRHIIKVLRKKEEDILHITNGLGDIFEVELIHISPKECIARIMGSEKQPPLPYSLHMAVAPTKLNDRYEWFLEKATEIGITEITPIICQHSERKTVNPDRFERILKSAMKQSLKARLPKLNKTVSFKEFIKIGNKAELNCIAHCEEGEKTGLKEILEPDKSVCILIGPEGDFSIEEIELAISSDFRPIHLGTSRLRTETAAIVACHSVAFINHR